MNTRIPPTGKKWAHKMAGDITSDFRKRINKMKPKELRSLIKFAEQLTESNISWDIYWLKDVIIKFAKDALSLPKQPCNK